MEMRIWVIVPRREGLKESMTRLGVVKGGDQIRNYPGTDIDESPITVLIPYTITMMRKTKRTIGDEKSETVTGSRITNEDCLTKKHLQSISEAPIDIIT